MLVHTCPSQAQRHKIIGTRSDLTITQGVIYSQVHSQISIKSVLLFHHKQRKLKLQVSVYRAEFQPLHYNVEPQGGSVTSLLH